jgi:hypothetical protein
MLFGRLVTHAHVRRALVGFVPFVFAVAASHSYAECYTQRRLPQAQHVVLAIDGSGSMSGAALDRAKSGARAFVSAMGADDSVAVVAFGSKVAVSQPFTRDRARLHRAIDTITAGGGTALYDAIARGALMLARAPGRRMLVYLTDARDVSSRYSLPDIRQMNVCEGILVYGIGLGDVDTESLSALSSATGGRFERADSPAQFHGLYMRVAEVHARRLGLDAAETGSIVVRSIPGAERAFVDGREVGHTPVRLGDMGPGSHDVMVLFDNSAWDCAAEVTPGHLTSVRARSSDLGADIVVVSRPAGAAVFLDDAYVGVTSYGTPISMSRPDWPRLARDDAQQLMIRRVPYGGHRLRLRGVPDFDFGSDQELDVELTVRDAETVLFADILRRAVFDETGAVVGRGAARDPFAELDGAR